jgi:L-2,4-diaminobutyric acid acetyltransferase
LCFDGRVSSEPSFRRPDRSDGAAMAKLAADAGGLDVNTTYAYVLWCRDFSGSSVVAEQDGALVGYITGYRRPDESDTLFVWQVAVDPGHRGRGLARRMLDSLVASVCPRHVEATVTPDNRASHALFASFADAHDAPTHREALFDAAHLGDDHEPEELVRIGPL